MNVSGEVVAHLRVRSRNLLWRYNEDKQHWFGITESWRWKCSLQSSHQKLTPPTFMSRSTVGYGGQLFQQIGLPFSLFYLCLVSSKVRNQYSIFMNQHSQRQDDSAKDLILYSFLGHIDRNNEGDGSSTSRDQASIGIDKSLRCMDGLWHWAGGLEDLVHPLSM